MLRKTTGRPRKKATCDICKKNFMRHQNMLDHKLDFHSNDLKKIICAVKNCGYRTNRIGNLNIHLQRKHDVNMKVIKCYGKNCKISKKSEKGLINHMKKCTHNPVFTSIKCFCGSEFLTQERLESHKRLCHPEKKKQGDLIEERLESHKRLCHPEKKEWEIFIENLNDLVYFP